MFKTFFACDIDLYDYFTFQTETPCLRVYIKILKKINYNIPNFSNKKGLYKIDFIQPDDKNRDYFSLKIYSLFLEILKFKILPDKTNSALLGQPFLPHIV